MLLPGSTLVVGCVLPPVLVPDDVVPPLFPVVVSPVLRAAVVVEPLVAPV